MKPRPLAELPARGVLGVFTDIDDTLTAEGQIEPAALAALHELALAGLPVIAITGRPMGWSEPFAREWPVAAIVAENGAVALIPGPPGVAVEFAQPEEERRANALKLEAAAQRILAEVPGARLARDSAGRVTDIAVDHSEFARLPPEAVERVAELMRGQGMNATVSSIHVNGWYGSHTKVTGAGWMLRRLLGRDLSAELGRWVYVGDSPNDQEMFARFPLSVGVANLAHFAARLHTWPGFLASRERGEGFAEVADHLLRGR